MNKKLLRLFLLPLGSAVLLAASSCSDEPDNTVTVSLSNAALQYDESGVWVDCQNPAAGNVVCQNVSFSHSAESSEWGTFWSGFCPSRSNDMADYSDGNWLDHQWGVMSGGGIAGLGTPFLVAYWNSSEGENPGDAASLQMRMADNAFFSIRSVYVNNSTYTYYTMKNGNAYSKKFDSGDWLKLLFYGVTESGAVTEPVEFYLADYRDSNSASWTMVKDWTQVNLEALNAKGALRYVYVQMASSDSGVFGMNTPGYFALDGLQIVLE